MFNSGTVNWGKVNSDMVIETRLVSTQVEESNVQIVQIGASL